MGKKRNVRWNSCAMWFVTSVGALCLTLSSFGLANGVDNESTDFAQRSTHNIPGCTTTQTGHNMESKLMLVSTLDGKLSALDVSDDSSKLLWSVSADSRPLLSSSISKLEILHEGVPTRYIPSLDGGLYRYDGESIEAVPMTAETLLSSSFKLADNTVMIGGKDLKSYGLDPKTGQIRYACGIKGCRMFGEEIRKEDDMLVVQRNTQTVRAVDSRTGSEKWNFSVGTHDLNFLKGQNQRITGSPGDSEDGSDVYCDIEGEEEDPGVTMDTLSNSIKIVVPEGMVVGVNPDNMQSVTWQHKFSSPVSNAWLLYRGEMKQLDMFGHDNIPAISNFDSEDQPLHQPLLYVGMHQSQLYVQPSSQMVEKMSDATERYNREQTHTVTSLTNLPRVAWKPYLNTAHWRTPTITNRHPQITSRPTRDEEEHCEQEDNALTIWHENYPFDNGFYLYPELTILVPTGNSSDDPEEEGQGSLLDEYLPVTLWNWWKEVIAISILTSVVVHIFLTRVQRAGAAILQHTNSTQSLSGSVNNSSSKSTDDIKDMETAPPSRQNSGEAEYVSRFASEFEHIQILGKGGFGVVFEVTNKVDECHYAVKRIELPNSDVAKEKVKRESKALAKLDHVGIVRYFHSWIESPPIGWQEDKDMEIEQSECITSPTPQLFSTTNYESSPKSSMNILGSSPPKIINKLTQKKASPLDFLQNPFGGNNLDNLEGSQSDGDLIKRGGSEEFSVQIDSESEWSRSGRVGKVVEELDDESGSFSCGMGTPNLSTFHNDGSLDIEFKLSYSIGESSEYSKSQNVNKNNCNNNAIKNVPFNNYKCSDRSLLSECDSSNDVEDTGSSFQIVFEDSGCAEKSSKGSVEDVCIGMLDSQSEGLLGSHDNVLGSTNTCSITKSRTHSRTHSRSLSRGSAKLTNENEKQTKSDMNKKSVEDASTRKRSTSPARPKHYMYIQMQLCKRESLKDWLSSNTLNRDRHTVLDIFDQIVCAIEYVHDCGLMHRDLKPSNLFFSLEGVVKMGDFGLVTALPEEQNEEYNGVGSPYIKHTAEVGTRLYMSPEQMSGKVYTQKVDIFSLGVILFELLYPFATQMERVHTLLGVKKEIFPERFTREMAKECELLRLLLSKDPDARPSATLILQSDLLKEFESRRMPNRFKTRTRTVSQNST